MLVFTLGIGAVSLVERSYDALVGLQLAAAYAPAPTLDSELRFYAPFWFSYGLLLLWIARHLPQRFPIVPFVTLVFFAGGLGRLLSMFVVGAPHPSFIMLMWIEILLPIIMMLLYWRLRQSHKGYASS